jgi:phage tail-like protein
MSARDNTQPAFRFLVTIDGENYGAFTECTIPGIEWDTQEIKEGGLNDYVHQLPSRRKSAKVTLKSGIGNTKLLRWYRDAMNEEWKRRKVTIKLMGVDHSTYMTWEIEGALPTKWAAPSLKTDDNTIAVETLELTCHRITVT